MKESVGANQAPPREIERLGAYDPNKNYPQPAPPMRPLMQQPPMYPPAPMPPAPKKELQEGEYNPKGRRFGIILAIVALGITLVSLFAIPLDFSDFDNTILRYGMDDGGSAILIMTFVTLAVAIIALLEPLFSIGSGICMIITAYLVFATESSILETPGMIVFILLAIDVMVLGIVATIFMKSFVNNNIKDVNLFRACYLAWTGIPHA